MSSNRFSGPIPPTFSNASTISVIELSDNNLTGRVPNLASLSELRWLIVDRNYLGNGSDDDLSFLPTLANKTSLEELSINDNNFGGFLPNIVSNFSENLKRITFGRNQIRGSIPSDIGNLIGLDTLGLEMNQLTGVIPNSIVLDPVLVTEAEETSGDASLFQLSCIESGTFLWDLRLMGSAELFLHQKERMDRPCSLGGFCMSPDLPTFHLQEQVVLDPVLVTEAEETSGDASRRMSHVGNHMECLAAIVKVGVACSAESPSERMEISSVSAELHRIRNILMGPQTHGQRGIISAPEVLDPVLVTEAEETSGDASRRMSHVGNHMECLDAIVKVGVACSAESPSERMEISSVSAELHRIRNILMGPQTHGQRGIISAPEGP
ncbi:hypothetical protein DKX38_012212 [Salix brachista]|uniref:Serine-threonine/tyrosine-protein kinase catalytic domain-containing protein n=1 Tax=Salix brachista TaxID=2182728 RepID=A0A5N5LN68_9ROSI|nr:hypothetical protein DKX38_012212 [Salix brachista]